MRAYRTPSGARVIRTTHSRYLIRRTRNGRKFQLDHSCDGQQTYLGRYNTEHAAVCAAKRCVRVVDREV